MGQLNIIKMPNLPKMNKFSAVNMIPMWDAKRAKDNSNLYHIQNTF